MNFTEAIGAVEARTENNMKARATSASANIDLFFKIGASRGKDIIPAFVKAFVENTEYALRITQWARDIRGGAGERQLFKNILAYLEKNQPDLAVKLIAKIPEIGRWDDMLIEYTDKDLEAAAFVYYGEAIKSGNALAAKWAPRKGNTARKLRNAWGMTPKQYRKTLVNLTNVVETKMCDRDWANINFSQVPSLASARYKSAFYKNAEVAFSEYVEKLTKGDKSVKVNAGAVYPYDVLKGQMSGWYGAKEISAVEEAHIVAQWNALENFVGNSSIFPIVDVSGSMTIPAGQSNITCLEVAVSLGLYVADKNKSSFKDAWMVFSENPTIEVLRGTIVQKMQQMSSNRNWGMNTNLNRAFQAMLDMAVNNKVPAKDMPKILLIFSDMQFDRCVEFDDSAIEMIKRKYEAAGYEIPKIVFWNLSAYDNVPVKFDKNGTALVSGFSPAIMKSILAGNVDDFTPESVMLETIMNKRYDI